MPDGFALPAIALLFVGLIALAAVWPQGQGARSPAPFGHTVAAPPTPIIPAIKQQLKLRGLESAPATTPRRTPNPHP